MIRPSALNLAERCGLGPALAAQYPEVSEAADRGRDIHDQIARGFGRAEGAPYYEPDHEGARAAVGLLGTWPGAVGADVEVEVVLRDEDGTEITHGTADAVLDCGADGLVVLDWKTGAPDKVPPATDNLQLAAYAIAAGLTREADAVSWAPVFVGDADVRVGALCSAWRADWPTWIARIKAAASRPAEATRGPWCETACYMRHHCPTWRAHIETALAPLGETALTDASALALVDRIALAEKWVAVAKEAARGFVRAGGAVERDGKVWGPSETKGRETADVAALDADGLGRYIKTGEPGERWGWKRA